LADVVITPSQFVYDSLPIVAQRTKVCHVVEFGSPSSKERSIEQDGNKARPLRVLFAGSMTQRKGLADLFAAMKLLQRRDVELIVMGSLLQPLDFYKRQYADFVYEPPRPHEQVLSLMQSCDVFVLPSIVEGRALVQQEAMACGLPLIVTPNAGGQDLLEEGKTGFLVPIRAPETIAEKIDWFATHRDQVPRMRESAIRKAAEYTWQRYGERIVDAVYASTQSSSYE
jgi:glycosyltransferase involved in cell wall biosynthesis